MTILLFWEIYPFCCPQLLLGMGHTNVCVNRLLVGRIMKSYTFPLTWARERKVAAKDKL